MVANPPPLKQLLGGGGEGELCYSFNFVCLVIEFKINQRIFLQATRGALHKASISGQHETVEMLLKSGEDVDQRDQVLSDLFLCKSDVTK